MYIYIYMYDMCTLTPTYIHTHVDACFYKVFLSVGDYLLKSEGSRWGFHASALARAPALPALDGLSQSVHMTMTSQRHPQHRSAGESLHFSSLQKSHHEPASHIHVSQVHPKRFLKGHPSCGALPTRTKSQHPGTRLTFRAARAPGRNQDWACGRRRMEAARRSGSKFRALLDSH